MLCFILLRVYLVLCPASFSLHPNLQVACTKLTATMIYCRRANKIPVRENCWIAWWRMRKNPNTVINSTVTISLMCIFALRGRSNYGSSSSKCHSTSKWYNFVSRVVGFCNIFYLVSIPRHDFYTMPKGVIFECTSTLVPRQKRSTSGLHKPQYVTALLFNSTDIIFNNKYSASFNTQ